jgi:hypothetical protein
MNLEHNPQWLIYDSTKIGEYLDCPRMFFYKRILGWKQDIQVHNDLQFGKAIHKAMEILYQGGFDDANVLKAYKEGFLPCYREVYGPETDELFSPKTPATALVALSAYTVYPANQMDFILFDIIKTEIAGFVPIDMETNIVYKIDLLARRKDNGKYFIMEHKTKKNSFTRTWSDQWIEALQIKNYLHALNMMLGPENVEEVLVNGIAFLKTKFDFQRVGVSASPDMMIEHLWNMRDIIDRMKLDLDLLLNNCKEEDRIMECYGKNPQSCTKYYGCSCAAFCSAWPNPLQRCDEPPPGYIIEHWDPLAEEQASERIDLELKEYL